MRNKKIVIITCITGFIVFLCSCQTARRTDLTNDETDNYGTKITTQSPPKATESNSDSASAKKKKKNIFTSILGSYKYLETDTTNLFMNSFFSGFKQSPAKILINPEENLAGFQVRYETVLYNLIFDKNTRNALNNDVQTYFNDFSNKKLEKSNKKTFNAYGQNTCYLEWGNAKGMMAYQSKTTCDFGYIFKKNSPFFTITIWPTTSEGDIREEADVITTQKIVYYFTKTQASMLLDLISEQKIADQISAYNENELGGEKQQNDTY
jgi:hypothetical protein